jgi:hypothetical protein
MQHQHAIGEDEMVAVFLRTEVASTRFAPTVLAILRRDGRERRIIEQPDLSNDADNAYRRHVLGEYRGYKRDADVFKDFPADVRWYRASATKEDLARVRYINDDYWTALSSGSRLVTDAVARIRQGIEVFGVSNGGFWSMADALAKGASFPELILVGTDEHAPPVLLEGHVRLTAYFLQPDRTPPSLPVIIGYAEGMVK